MNKRSKLLIIFIGIIGISLIMFILFNNNSKYLDDVDIDNYLIHYYTENDLLYDIETKNNGIFIIQKEIIMCIDAPCDPIEMKNYVVKYQKEYVDFVKELFKDNDIKEITIREENLNSKQVKIIAKIINEQ